METFIVAIIVGLGLIALVALAGFAFWYWCVREEPIVPEDDPEAPLVAHLQKNVRIQKRPSRAALSEAGLQLTHFYLRSSRYIFVKALPEIGGRTEKVYSLVRLQQGAELALALTPRSPYSAFPYHTESQQRLLRSLLMSLKHPFIAQISDVDFIPERDVLVTFRRWSSKGSLKDYIHKSLPAGLYDKKYASVAKLSLERIALFGRQILEALNFMRERGFPYGHLHAGNVIMEDGACCLSDFENAFLNIEPERIIGTVRQYPSGSVEPDALAFGLVVFEMTFGYELDSSLQLSRIRELEIIPAKAPPIIKSILELIFSGSPDARVSALLQHPFFANAPLRDEHRFEIGLATKEQPALEPKAKDMLRTVYTSFCINDLAAYDKAKSAPPPSLKQSISGKKKKKRVDGTGTSASSLGTSLGTTPSSVSSSALSARSPPAPPPRSTPSPAPIPPRSPASPAPAAFSPSAAKPPPAAPLKAPAPPPPPQGGPGRGALLSSIQSFSAGKLKKAVTVDKSKPRLGKS